MGLVHTYSLASSPDALCNPATYIQHVVYALTVLYCIHMYNIVILRSLCVSKPWL